MKHPLLPFLSCLITLVSGSCEVFEFNAGKQVDGKYTGLKHYKYCYPIDSDTAISACSESWREMEVLVERTKTKNQVVIEYDSNSDLFLLDEYGESPDGSFCAKGSYAGDNSKRWGHVSFTGDSLDLWLHELDGAASSGTLEFSGGRISD